MAIQFSGITNTPALPKTQTPAFTAHTPKLEMGKDTVSFGNAATKVAKEVADDVVKSKPVREFISKNLKAIGGLIVKCKDLIVKGVKATGSGTMTGIKAIGKALVWPFKAIAGLFAKKAPEAAEVVEKVVKAAT